jgi:hypothetical protein
MKSSPSEAQRSFPYGIETIRIFCLLSSLVATELQRRNKKAGGKPAFFRFGCCFPDGGNAAAAAIGYINSLTSP